MIKIGVIGIGSIGTAVCNKLLKNGYGLCIYNRTAEKANSFRGFKNVNIAKTPSDVFLSCKTTILALTDDDATRQVVLKNKFIRNWITPISTQGMLTYFNSRWSLSSFKFCFPH